MGKTVRLTDAGQTFLHYARTLLTTAQQAKAVMRERMRLSLSLFAAFGARNLVLGAYGCGVFQNDPAEISRWWKELFREAKFQNRFESVLFAVLDSSKNQACWRAFQKQFDPPAG